jgi:hypothetical protein
MLNRLLDRSSRRGPVTRSSSRASEMDLDVPEAPSLQAHTAPSSSQAPPSPTEEREEVPISRILKRRDEKKRYKELKARTYSHTPVMDLQLLLDTGMASEFDQIFAALGWGYFWNITEEGIWDLSVEFLSTLSIVKDCNRTPKLLGPLAPVLVSQDLEQPYK